MGSQKSNSLLYMSIYRQLIDDIRSGVYRNGSLLPPEPELMERFNASRTTIRHAITLLKENDLVTVRQGRGTIVTYQDDDRYTSITASEKFRSISSIVSQAKQEGTLKTQNGVVDLIEATKEVAEKLSLQEGDAVYRIRRVKLIDNQPFGFLISFLPARQVPDFEAYNGKITTLYTTLKEAYGIYISQAKEYISSCSCGAIESLLLNVPLHTPLLYLTRIGYREDNVFEYTKSYYNPDKYEIVVSMDGLIDYTKDDDISSDSIRVAHFLSDSMEG